MSKQPQFHSSSDTRSCRPTQPLTRGPTWVPRPLAPPPPWRAAQAGGWGPRSPACGRTCTREGGRPGSGGTRGHEVGLDRGDSRQGGKHSRTAAGPLINPTYGMTHCGLMQDRHHSQLRKVGEDGQLLRGKASRGAVADHQHACGVPGGARAGQGRGMLAVHKAQPSGQWYCDWLLQAQAAEARFPPCHTQHPSP